MLIHAFAGEMLERVKIEALRDALEGGAVRAAARRTWRKSTRRMTTARCHRRPPAAHRPFDVQTRARRFPDPRAKVHGKPLVYLDNAATTPEAAGGARRDRRLLPPTINANVHRGVHELSERATEALRRRAREARPAVHQRTATRAKSSSRATRPRASIWSRRASRGRGCGRATRC